MSSVAKTTGIILAGAAAALFATSAAATDLSGVNTMQLADSHTSTTNGNNCNGMNTCEGKDCPENSCNGSDNGDGDGTSDGNGTNNGDTES